MRFSKEETRAFAVLLERKFLKYTDNEPFFFESRPEIELFRKILMRLRLCHDVISLTQRQTAESILRLRKAVQQAESVALPHRQGCRFLLRVDDFPADGADSAAFQLFHDILRDHGIPYLLAITPYFHEKGLEDHEIEILQCCRKEGMTPALHGFTHRRVRPEVPSELLGLSETDLRSSITKAITYLKKISLESAVFVAPYNSYDPQTVPILSEYFPILCGGPESVRGLGYRGPGFIEKSLYLPSYRGAYDLKKDIRWIVRIKDEGHGLLVPITLHWVNELQDNFKNLVRICRIIRTQMLSWDSLVPLHASIDKALNDL